MSEEPKPRRISRLGIALVLCAAAIVFCWPTLRAHMQAAAVLMALEHKRVPIIFAGVALHPIGRQQLALQPPDGSAPVRAYLYTPADVANPRDIVLIHGVHRLGMDEPRLVTLATALAQSGFRVLTPEIVSLKNYRVDPTGTAQIEAAVQWLSTRDHETTGVAGLSFAGGLAVLAAADPATAPHVAWVWSIGGHAQMQRVANYYVTGTATGADGQTFTAAPHEYGPLVLAFAHPEDFLSAADQPALLPVLRAHLYENSAGEQTLLSHLSSAQQATWKSLLDTGSAQEQQRLQASIAKHAAEYAAVSPEGRVQAVAVPVFLLHGAADNVIPPTELSWLAKDVPSNDVREALESRAISHVSVEQDPGLWEDWKLVHFVAGVLRYAEK